MDYKDIVYLFTNFPLLIALVIIGRNYLKFSIELKVISWYVFFSVIVQFLSQYFASQRIENLFLLHLFVPVRFVCLSIFYQKTFDRFIHRKLLWWIMGLFVLFSVLNSIVWQGFFTFNSYALSVESVLLIIYSLSLFTLLLNDEVRRERKKLLPSLLWINSGLFMYYTSGLLLFYFGDLLTHLNFSKATFQISWLFHSFIYIVLFACIIIGLWKHPKK